jgi:hypothetical protein
MAHQQNTKTSSEIYHFWVITLFIGRWRDVYIGFVVFTVSVSFADAIGSGPLAPTKPPNPCTTRVSIASIFLYLMFMFRYLTNF